MNIGIIDYGIGNLGSVKRAIELAGADASFISDPSEVDNCKSLIFFQWLDLGSQNP